MAYGVSMTKGYWKFIELKHGTWAWQLQELDGHTSRVGPFLSLEKCIANAKEYGYEEKQLDSRYVQRAS